MILNCEKCNTSFSFDERMIKKSGSKVRCSKCRNVFVVYPPAEEKEAAVAAPVGRSATEGVAGLGDLDLEAIEKSLDLEDEDNDAVQGSALSGKPVSAGTGFDFEEDDVAVQGATGTISEEDTDELNFDLDLDSEPDDKVVSGITEESTETMDFHLDFDLDDSADNAPESETAAEEDSLEGGLDLGLDDAAEGGPDFPPAAEEKEPPVSGDVDDLDFGLDLELDDDTGQTKPDELDFSLDLGKGEKSVVADSGVEFDETQELDLSDVDSLLDLGHGKANESAAVDETEDLDFDLDLGDEDKVLAGEEKTEGLGSETDELDLGLDLDFEPQEETAKSVPESTSVDDLDFGLDLEGDAPDAAKPVGAAGMESTEELDLADLEEMIESDEDALPVEDAVSDEPDLDAGLDLAMDAVEATDTREAKENAEVTDDFDLTDLDDLLDLDDDADAPGQGVEDAATADIEMDSGTASLTDDDAGAAADALDDLLDVAPEEPAKAEAMLDSTDELDLADLAGESADDLQEDAVEEEEDEDADFDLSDLDDMLEIEDEPEGEAEDDEFELDLDMEEVTPESGAAEVPDNVELEFEIEEDSTDDEMASAAAMAGAGAAATADEFDMGAISESEVDAEETFSDSGRAVSAKPARGGKKGVGTLIRTLLVLALLAGGVYGAYFATQFFGIDIPYLDKIKGIRIPYLSDLIGPKIQDSGNLKMTILEQDVDGRFTQNAALGTLYVVTGQLKNAYDHPRSFIQVTGKLYAKGRKPVQEKTVFAGNVLSNSELAVLDQAGIDKKLGNRMGQDRSNLNLKKDATIPFMIVFSNLPPDPDEYTVEVARSQKAN